jgi:electron transfer flavoprotein alpha/beta subunit
MPKVVKAAAKVDGKRRTVEVSLPIVVGVTRAAEILGIPKPNVSRMRRQGRMPEPLEQDGPGAPVFVRSEVEALARELQAEREARAARGEDGEDGGA